MKRSKDRAEACEETDAELKGCLGLGGQRDIVLEVEPTGLTNAIAQNDVLLLPGAFVIRSVGISDVRDQSQCCLGFGNDSDFSYLLIPILPPGRDGRGGG